MNGPYVIGIDFGTLSGRAVVVDVSTGEEVGVAVHPYQHGVISDTLPDTDISLQPDWALQDPADYIAVLQNAVPAALAQSPAQPSDIIGIGVDFTSCTMLPTTREGVPLCQIPEWRQHPHAWVKLWKHHAAQPEADKINEVAHSTGFSHLLARYGGKVNSEWLLPKIWQILDEAPEIYDAAERFIEAGDWLVWQLTGRETRNACAAGYKGMWSKAEGYPPPQFLKALDPRLRNLVAEKLGPEVLPLGTKAGTLTAEAAAWMGLPPQIPVAVAVIDAHAAAPAATLSGPGCMAIIMGTSNCHMVVSPEEVIIPGISGVVADGILPGLFGYEAGQACVGDHFAWFVENATPAAYAQEAAARNISLYALLEEKAAQLQPGESGLLALDWWNGNRSVLVDADLTGLILGMTLTTKPEEIYRALIEATAFGTRIIIETFIEHGIEINEIVATGGLPDQNKLLMQIYADVTGLPFYVAASSMTSALGAAMHGAVAAGSAAGGYDSLSQAARHMAKLRPEKYQPDMQAHLTYDVLYEEYKKLHDYFGRGQNYVMKRLKELRRARQ